MEQVRTVCECGERLYRDRGGLRCLNDECRAYWFAEVETICRQHGASEVAVIHRSDGPPSDSPLEQEN